MNVFVNFVEETEMWTVFDGIFRFHGKKYPVCDFKCREDAVKYAKTCVQGDDVIILTEKDETLTFFPTEAKEKVEAEMRESLRREEEWKASLVFGVCPCCKEEKMLEPSSYCPDDGCEDGQAFCGNCLKVFDYMCGED